MKKFKTIGNNHGDGLRSLLSFIEFLLIIAAVNFIGLLGLNMALVKFFA